MPGMRLRIAICGCGPAGLAAALLLHRGGHHVVILERFERAKPLGSGLIVQPTGLVVLHELGLDRPSRRAHRQVVRTQRARR
jgi:salicylate hydroxylase